MEGVGVEEGRQEVWPSKVGDGTFVFVVRVFVVSVVLIVVRSKKGVVLSEKRVPSKNPPYYGNKKGPNRCPRFLCEIRESSSDTVHEPGTNS